MFCIYDNPNTFQREYYQDGELVRFITDNELRSNSRLTKPFYANYLVGSPQALPLQLQYYEQKFRLGNLMGESNV